MKLTYLNRFFLFRSILLKQGQHYTEVETNVLIGIYLMNSDLVRCSCNTLTVYLSKMHRTPYKKTLLATLQKFKQDGVIRQTGKGRETNMHLTIEGKMYLFRLEGKISMVRFSND